MYFVKNFYRVWGSCYFDVKKYLFSWSQFIGLAHISKTEDVLEQQERKAQSLAAQVQKLWRFFNEDRSALDKHYMETHTGLVAYCAAFLLPNIERVFSLLTAEENSRTWVPAFFEKCASQSEIVLVDFGSGPLSASVGFLSALEFFLSSEPNLKPPKIYIYAIDRSEKIVQAGERILQQSLFTPVLVEVIRVPSIAKVPVPIDFALCSNVFNEIPEKHRLKTILPLTEKLTPNGGLLIIEPGQEEHARALGSLRDGLLAQPEQAHMQILSPCPHTGACPLSTTSPRKDWCWFRHTWEPIPEVQMLDKMSNLNHTTLNFSYVFFHKSKATPPEESADKLNARYFARAVSDCIALNSQLGSADRPTAELPRTPEQQNPYKILLCCDDGTLKAGYLNSTIKQLRGKKFMQENELENISVVQMKKE